MKRPMPKAQSPKPRAALATAVLIVIAFLFPPVYSEDGFRYLFLPTMHWHEGRVDTWLLLCEFVAIGMLARIVSSCAGVE